MTCLPLAVEWLSKGEASPLAACVLRKRHNFFACYVNCPLTRPRVVELISRRPPEHAFPIPPYRYMDNIVGAICGNVGVTRLRNMFEKLYGLELQQEYEGLVIPILEAVLSVQLDTVEVFLRLKTKEDWNVPPHTATLQIS